MENSAQPFGNAAGGGRFKIKNISQNTSFYQSQLFKMIFIGPGV
jgi:hypothetical protein